MKKEASSYVFFFFFIKQIKIRDSDENIHWNNINSCLKYIMDMRTFYITKLYMHAFSLRLTKQGMETFDSPISSSYTF